MAATDPTVIPVCPWWCTESAGHDYESTDGGPRSEPLDFQRFHVQEVGDLTVDAFEHNRDGVVTVDAAGVHLDERGNLDAGKCRALAADLLAAADLLDRITAST